jgi:hypothetical protein
MPIDMIFQGMSMSRSRRSNNGRGCRHKMI